MRIAGAGGSGEDRDRLLERLDDLASLGLSLRVERLEGVFEGRLLRRLDDGLRLRVAGGAEGVVGEHLRLSYRTPDGVAGFDTRLHSRRGDTWTLTLPEEISEVTARVEARLEVPGSAGVVVQVAQGRQLVEIDVMDLSSSGFALRFPAVDPPPRRGDRLSCRVLQRGLRVATLKVEVANVLFPPGGALRVGCRFIHACAEAKRSLDTLAKRVLVELDEEGTSAA